MTLSPKEAEMSTKRKTPSQHGNMKCRQFQTEAERDSGFSDAGSEHFSTMETTDSEDSPGPLRPKGTSSKAGAPLAVVGGSYSNLSPMIIMNNVVLKQPGDPPPALKPWSFNPAVEVVQPVVQQPQVVFLQPVVSRQTSSTSKTSNKHRRSKKYLPILKSYPKIAPRDSSSSSSSSSSSGRGTASSISSGSSSTSDRSGQKERSTKEKSHRSHGSGAQNTPSTQSAVPPLLQNQLSLPSTHATNNGISKDCPTGLSRSSELATQPPLSLPSNPHKHALQVQQTDQESISGAQLDSEGDGDVRRKRFCNTYNILSKSGLLDITLRTKELLRQNKRTQSDIERLKEQTELFLQALRSGDANVCAKLQATLRDEDKERETERRDVKM